MADHNHRASPHRTGATPAPQGRGQHAAGPVCMRCHTRRPPPGSATESAGAGPGRPRRCHLTDPGATGDVHAHRATCRVYWARQVGLDVPNSRDKWDGRLSRSASRRRALGEARWPAPCVPGTSFRRPRAIAHTSAPGTRRAACVAPGIVARSPSRPAGCGWPPAQPNRKLWHVIRRWPPNVGEDPAHVIPGMPVGSPRLSEVIAPSFHTSGPSRRLSAKQPGQLDSPSVPTNPPTHYTVIASPPSAGIKCRSGR